MNNLFELTLLVFVFLVFGFYLPFFKNLFISAFQQRFYWERFRNKEFSLALLLHFCCGMICIYLNKKFNPLIDNLLLIMAFLFVFSMIFLMKAFFQRLENIGEMKIQQFRHKKKFNIPRKQQNRIFPFFKKSKASEEEPLLKNCPKHGIYCVANDKEKCPECSS